MKSLADPQKLVHRFNEDEAAWREYVYFSGLHHRFRLGSTIPNILLDRIDWLAAEWKHRVVRCIGRALS